MCIRDSVDSVAINTAGDANYAEGDVITISGAGANATFTIPSGGLLVLSLLLLTQVVVHSMKQTML